MDNPEHAAQRRVWSLVSPQARQALEHELSPADLHTLLLAVLRTRSQAVTPARLLQRWRQDRFVRAAAADPRQLVAVEAKLWQLLPHHFAGVELAPVAPLGTCSALAPVDQHWVVATVRGTEVLSDPTNALAIEAARRRTLGALDWVDLAACHRVLRAQPFSPGNAAHFRLFCLVSSARDRGGGATEAQLLTEHLSYWQLVLATVLPTVDTYITVTAFEPGPVTERLHDTVLPAVASGPVPVSWDHARTQGAGYYAACALALRTTVDGQTVDLGDGGLTTWTAQLLADRKERCLVSCAATERLTALTPPASLARSQRD